MPRPPFATSLLAVTALLALAAGGCTTGYRPANAGGFGARAPYAWTGGGADVGPLTDARGRRRSLALAPTAGGDPSGPEAHRNDIRRGVTAGVRGATVRSAQTRTIDRGPGNPTGFGSGRRSVLRDGFNTRTIRRSFTESVR